jgi:hypothetical protein
MEAKPILEPGLHDFELSDISNHFLKDFPESKTRKTLIDGLTDKIDPSDIDLVIFSPEAILNVLPPEKQKLFNELTDRQTIKQNFGCDVLFCPSEDDNARSYWRGWYGFDRNENPKGIARIMVTV